MTSTTSSLDAARTTIDAVLEQTAREGGGTPCSADSCHDPLCPVHAAAERERLGQALWTPPPGAQPWQALQDGTLALGSILDHTILRPDATPADIEAGCHQALELGCAAFCANPLHVPLVARLLAGSPVKVCTVAGFPLGATTTAMKVEETRWAVAQGAHEVDMVISIGTVRERLYDTVIEDIREVVRVAHEGGARCKVILEIALLNAVEKIAVCLLAARAGADFVKTSTGYSKSGATTEDVALMRLVVGDSLGVKAAGGIRTREQALAMLESGASRIGTSSSLAIVREGSPREGE